MDCQHRDRTEDADALCCNMRKRMDCQITAVWFPMAPTVAICESVWIARYSAGIEHILSWLQYAKAYGLPDFKNNKARRNYELQYAKAYGLPVKGDVLYQWEWRRNIRRRMKH